MKFTPFLLMLVVSAWATVSHGQDVPPPEPNQVEETDGPILIWVGRSRDEEWQQELPAPDIDHYFHVVDIFPLEKTDVGVLYNGCFVQVEDVPWDGRTYIPTDENGNFFTLDLDGVFKPMRQIAVDTSDCSPPFRADPNEPA